MRSRQRSRTLALVAFTSVRLSCRPPGPITRPSPSAWIATPTATQSTPRSTASPPPVPATLQDLNVPLNRYGGNSATAYNWQQNADNRGNDWYFESIGDTSSVAGERGDTFIANTKTAGAKSMITIPMVDWVAKLGSGRSKLAAF